MREIELRTQGMSQSQPMESLEKCTEGLALSVNKLKHQFLTLHNSVTDIQMQQSIRGYAPTSLLAFPEASADLPRPRSPAESRGEIYFKNQISSLNQKKNEKSLTSSLKNNSQSEQLPGGGITKINQNLESQ